MTDITIDQSTNQPTDSRPIDQQTDLRSHSDVTLQINGQQNAKFDIEPCVLVRQSYATEIRFFLPKENIPLFGKSCVVGMEKSNFIECFIQFNAKKLFLGI